MKPAQRLHLVIILAALLPTFAVIWSRLHDSGEHAQDQRARVALRLVMQEAAAFRGVEPETQDERLHAALSRWLEKHPSHPCASLLRAPLSQFATDHPNTKAFHLGHAEQAARAILDTEK